jgi:hypothetical protein
MADKLIKILHQQWYVHENNAHFTPSDKNYRSTIFTDFHPGSYLLSMMSVSTQNLSGLVDGMVNLYYHDSRLTPEINIIYYGICCSTAIMLQYGLFFAAFQKALKHITHIEQIFCNNSGTRTPQQFSPEGL